MATALTQVIDEALSELMTSDDETPKASDVAELAIQRMSKSARDEAIKAGTTFRARYRIRARQGRKLPLDDVVETYLKGHPDATDEELAQLVRERTAAVAA